MSLISDVPYSVAPPRVPGIGKDSSRRQRMPDIVFARVLVHVATDSVSRQTMRMSGAVKVVGRFS